MGVETLSECIYAWMRAEDVTASQLAERLGYKSKTSLFRLLHDKSNYQSCVHFCDLISPSLDECWKGRFRRALLTQKIGKSRHALLEAMNRRLFDGDAAEPDPSPISGSVPFSRGTVTVLGCTLAGADRFIDALLAETDQLRVIHYFTRRDLFDSPALLPGLIARVVSMNYSALLLDEAVLYGANVPWNIALWTDENDANILLMNDEECSWQPLPGGAIQARHIIRSLDALPGTALYRYDHLQTGKEYIEFTEQNYRMEYNRKALIIKPNPGMQMLPADIVEHSFIDFLTETLEPVSAARDTLIYIFEKRVKNFHSRTKPTYLALSLDSMLRFARDGVLDDQFFACRPFTEAERIKIIHALQSFSQKENVFVSFLDQKIWPVSAEAYDGPGVLFYPSASNYNTSSRFYRELFLPGKEYSDFMFQFAGEYGLFDDRNLKSSDDIYKKMLRTAMRQKT